MKRSNFPARKEQRRKEAEGRNLRFQQLAVNQKIEKITSAPGNATKQRKQFAV